MYYGIVKSIDPNGVWISVEIFHPDTNELVKMQLRMNQLEAGSILTKVCGIGVQADSFEDIPINGRVILKPPNPHKIDPEVLARLSSLEKD